MDFALFMERYGYKLLALIFIIALGIVFGPFLYGFVILLKKYPTFTIVMFVVGAVYTFLFRSKYWDAYAKAMAKYFYDDKYGKRP
ncbi:hypothetical protein A3L04_09335 [Thermococcus chitonophagus]|uniref:Uncharacterized protein n=1 Tax=Thermococcus chitonophagus TaxID=54262 RepID=A0A160VS39_9EURY|nr:hypothetical protein [Thermococcus chitonophagus]ASJ17253.1 hypothetical protein A3L04_09335 [Thermococcus chitonophagus]CUX77873.1 hypothetical protein CHITON_1094 [Thermococcus chitonophagus]